MSHLIRMYTICHLDFDFYVTSLFSTMDTSTKIWKRYLFHHKVRGETVNSRFVPLCEYSKSNKN